MRKVLFKESEEGALKSIGSCKALWLANISTVHVAPLIMAQEFFHYQEAVVCEKRSLMQQISGGDGANVKLFHTVW